MHERRELEAAAKKNNDAQNARELAGLQASVEKVQVKKVRTTTGNKNSNAAKKAATRDVPIRLTNNFFLANKEQALANLTRYRDVLINITTQSLHNPKSQNPALAQNANAELTRVKEKINEIDRPKETNNSNNDGRYYVLLIRDIVASDSMFSADIINTKIFQTYSFRSGDLNNTGQFNMGLDSCWDINFPDVSSLSSDFNPFLNILEIADTSKIKIKTEKIDNSVSKRERLSDLSKQATDLETEINEKLKKKKITNEEIEGLMDKINGLFDSTNKIKDPMVKIRDQYNINYEIDTLSEKTPYTSRKDDMQTIKKNAQNFRKRMLLTSYPIPITMKIIGDPNIELNDIGARYFFLKHLNPDGSLGFFTGVYILQGFSHEITSSGFSTQIEGEKYPFIQDQNSMDDFLSQIYEHDTFTIAT